ncbi:MAG TPA: hypothetical protein VM715_02690 [Candidatus Acidoferrum sp.]|nr:hypothetical protein [Candidatus Acidoferrum sp.]
MEPISELYAECADAIRLYDFTKKAYSNLIDNAPKVVSDQIRDANIYLYQELHRTLEEELTSSDAYSLCAFVSAVMKEHPGFFAHNLDEEKDGSEEPPTILL